jgi:predicted transcriptional regulator
MRMTVTVRLPPAVEKRLDRLAGQTKRTRGVLAGQAIADFVDRELAIINGIKRGLADADAGRVISHKKAIRRLRDTVARVSKPRS